MTIDDKIKYIDDYKKAKNAATGSKYDANSNVTEKNLATLQCELGKKDLIDVNRRITCDYLTKLYGKETADAYLDDLKNHIIYRHDETALFPYCVSISLYPFLLHGLTNLGGSSLPPKHADSFMGGVINLIYLVAAQFAGAVSTPELLTYLDHFLRIDYGNDYMGHLDDNLEAFGNRRKTLRTKIEDMFQQFVYSVNQPAGARNYQSPFTNIAYFDRYYFENIFKDFVFPDGDQPCWESTSRLQKMFMEWFCEERTHALLTFPVETANILVKSTDHIDGDFPETLDRDINWDATQPKRDVNDYILRHMVRKADGRYYYYADADMADFICHMDAKGHCPFVYQSDSVDALASCCRLRNEIKDNVFSTSLGAGGIETGSKCVITANINRIVQNWDRDKDDYLTVRIGKSRYLLGKKASIAVYDRRTRKEEKQTAETVFGDVKNYAISDDAVKALSDCRLD